jgi:hypothetical protein
LHPEVGRTVYSIVLSLMVILGISFLYLTPADLSFYIALIAMFFLLGLLAWIIYDVRKEAM